MNFVSQQDAIFKLKSLADANRHSILIEGIQGCGKTYLAGMYAQFLNISDVISVQPVVSDIRSILDECYKTNSPCVICIENLDQGVKNASYTLLKFVEEPTTNVYVVITCRNLSRVPDTIPSRCTQVSVSPPLNCDIDSYASNKDSKKYNAIRGIRLWKCVRTFTDVDDIFRLSNDELHYFEDTLYNMDFSDSISSLTWAISHFQDNTETPITLVVRFLLNRTKNKYLKSVCIDCLKELQATRLSQNAILSKLMFEFKYGGE